MKIQPIASYEQRQAQYREELRQFVLSRFSWLCVLGLMVSLGMAYVLTHCTYQGIGPIEADWFGLGLALCFVTLVPVFMMLKPVPPRPGDVAADQALRRAFGMDDTLSR